MINTTQSTYNLTLSAEQFDALHELLDETITDYSSDLDLEIVDLNDIEIYQVFQQMNRFKEGESNNEIDKITDEFDKLERENDSLKSLLKEVN